MTSPASRSSCGAVRATPDAARCPTSRTPGGPPPSWASSTTCSTSATSSTATSSGPTWPTTWSGARRTRASSATATSSSTPCSSGRTCLGFDALATGHHARVVRLADGIPPHRPRCRSGQGPVLRAVPGHRGPAGPRAVPDRRPDQGRGAAHRRRPEPAHRRQARQPGRLLHHPRRRPGCLPVGAHGAAPRRGASTPTAARSVGPTRSSWSPSASARAWAWPAATTAGSWWTWTCPPPPSRSARPRGCSRRRWSSSTWCGPAGPVDGAVTAQCSAHGETSPGECSTDSDGRRGRVGPAPTARRSRPERRAVRRRPGHRRRPRRLT